MCLQHFWPKNDGASFDASATGRGSQMDPPYLAATSRWSELPSGGLVAGGHSGGFASMLQYVAAGATWSQKSRAVGRQAFSFSSTSTANSKMASYGGGKQANRSDFYTEVASIAHSRAKRWKNGEGDINFFVTRKEEYQFKGERENGQPVVDAQPGRKPHERGVAEEKKGRSKKRTFGQNGRAGGGRMKLRARGKPSFLKTLENFKAGSVELKEAINSLEEGFYAESSKNGRACRVQQVLQLATQVAGSNPFPLTRHTVVATAACLKKAKLVSADQYMGLLRTMHVEEGYEVSEYLNRIFTQCRRSLKRDRGPERRAPEFKIEEIDVKWLEWKGKGVKAVQWPVLAYVWATHWMLREIELRECQIGDILLDQERRQVTLAIRKSKTDQAAMGTKRTLKCICQPCRGGVECAWTVANMVVKAAKGRDASEPAFLTNGKVKTTKEVMVAAWNKLLMAGIKGHSPRRSGAMRYVRAGMQIQELAFLGRWKSVAVLRYAEEALREVPANSRLDLPPQKKEVETFEVLDVEQKPQWDDVVTKNQEDKEEGGISLQDAEPARELLVKATTRTPFRPAHVVALANWKVPMSEWSTACGWKFATNPRGFEFLFDEEKSKHRCTKCHSAMEGRDKVKEVQKWRTQMPNVGQ